MYHFIYSDVWKYRRRMAWKILMLLCMVSAGFSAFFSLFTPYPVWNELVSYPLLAAFMIFMMLVVLKEF